MNEPGTTTEDALVLSQRIAAPQEAVFEFLVDPEKVLRWMGTAVDIEPEPGGKFWINVTGTDIASGSYLAVEPPRQVAFSWGWEGSTDVPPGSSTVTITLESEGDETIVELRHEGLPGGADDQHSEGWNHFLPRLEAVALGNDPGPNHPHG